MPPLPDVDSASYNEYTADQFGQQTERRIGALGFQVATEARIASLNEQYAPSPPPQPAPEPPPPPPEPALPALSASPETGPYSAPASLSAQPAVPTLTAPAPVGPSATSTPAPASPPPMAQAGGPDYVAAALNAADQHGIDPHLFVSLIQQESQFNPNARSPVGAQGLGQLMPDTARGLGVDPNDPIQNLTGAARYFKQNLEHFGGDVVKALAAYNAGPGAVEKFGGIPPYEETQRYVDLILGRLQAEAIDTSAQTGVPGTYAPGPTEGLQRVGSDLANQQHDISQFGDPQLTSDEAYAACGPAAAVRFAQRFGRNPTLREATDLAAQVGWTSSQGMAGLSSEKALMDKLQVPTKLVNGPAWDVFAKEAQTGNPVTISTAGHYFTADGFNPDTGAFHVGKSGLDLKGGAEWMTPARMTALMGEVQGGLLADNPQVPAPSIADQDSNPLAWLGRQKDALVSAIGATAARVQSPNSGNPVVDAAGTAASALGTGVQSALSPFGGASEQFPTGGPLAGPLVGGVRTGAGFEQMGREGAADAQKQLLDLLNRRDQGEQGLDAQIDHWTQVYDQATHRGENRVQSLSEAAQRNPDIGGLEGMAGAAQAVGAAPLAAEGAPLAAKAAAAVVDPLTGLPAVAGQTGRAVGQFARDESGALDVSRFFHGTGSDFPRPNAAKFDPNGLYGPGYYLTDDPRVAGGTITTKGALGGADAQQAHLDGLRARLASTTAPADASRLRQQIADARDAMTTYLHEPVVRDAGYAQQRGVSTVAEIQDSIARQQRVLDEPSRYPASALDQARREMPLLQAELEQEMARGVTGPNVRAVDVPQNLNLLDAEAPITAAVRSRVERAIAASGPDTYGAAGPVALDRFRQQLDQESQYVSQVTGDTLHRVLSGVVGQDSVNKVLANAGYDGIQYAGGQRVPMTDAAGQAIQHTAVNIFPGSLDKLRNAISGTQGGAINPQFASTIGGAAAGGGSTYAATDENDPNRALKVAGGALAGGALGYGAGRALSRRGAPPASAGPAYQSVMPSGTFETAKSTSTGSLSTQVTAARDTVFRTITRGVFDRQVDINQVQQAYARALGRPLNADEMAAELQRLSADPAAAVKIDEGLKPAIQSVGDDYNALRDYVTLRSNVQVADALGNDARMFSGGITKADSQKALTDLEAQLGPQRFQTVQQAADQVSQFSTDLRQRLVDAGVLSTQQAADMDAKYPDWVKTRILDYMKDPQGGQGAGTKIGLSSRDVHAYTQAGTQLAREDPIASTVAYAHQVERMANKNEAFNAFLNIDQASPAPMLRQVPQDFSPTKNQVTIVGFENGQKVKYVTDNRALGEAINGAGVMSVPEWTSAWQKVFRSLATSRNPVFLAGNAALDIPTYTFRTAIRDGGPQHLPGIMADLAKGYADAFQGLFQGEYRGAGTSAFLKGGGGQSGYFTGGEGIAKQTIADLQRSNVFQINGKADLLRLTRDLLTLKPVEALGERIELGPRVAAYNRALARGANATQAVIDGRTVTVDFSQGGTVTKYLNNFVPFLNVAAQGPVQLARAWRDNPRAFVATAGTLIGLPTVAAEVWNRSDPQRAKDYADIPEYVKNQGLVVMLPGDAPIDAQGNRKPLYAVLKLREWAPFASIARDATARALGDDTKGWQDMAASAGSGLSPTQSSSIGGLGSEALSGIPVVPAALQLEQNRDFFRNRNIVTSRADTNASGAAHSLTPVIQAAVDKLGLNLEVHPSAVDFFIRNQGAGVGGAALGASDLGKPRQDTSPTSLPGVGGLIGRFVGNQTGQGMQTARDEGLTPSARQILRQNGITSTPGPASSSVNQIPLKLDEETRHQQLTNRYVDEAIHRVVQTPEWATMTQQGKDLVMQRTIGAARQRAGAETLSSIPEQERLRRLQTKSTAPSAPAVGGSTR